MKPAIKRKWIQLLKSGKFRQDRYAGRLEVESDHQGHKKYCCLGVLRTCMPDNLRQASSTSGVGALLNQAQLRWAGLKPSQQMRATIWNDVEGFRFNKIARLIQKEF